MKKIRKVAARSSGMKSFIGFSVCIALSFCCASADAQHKGNFKIGVLTPAERQWERAAFREGLRSLGYIEGSNISIDVRSAEGKLERIPELAAPWSTPISISLFP